MKLMYTLALHLQDAVARFRIRSFTYYISPEILMLDRLNELQAKVDAEKAQVVSGAGDYLGATRAGFGIGSILDIISEVIAIVRGIVAPSGAKAAADVTESDPPTP
jgi:hypothetical protein